MTAPELLPPTGPIQAVPKAPATVHELLLATGVTGTELLDQTPRRWLDVRGRDLTATAVGAWLFIADHVEHDMDDGEEVAGLIVDVRRRWWLPEVDVTIQEAGQAQRRVLRVARPEPVWVYQ